jgi:hypothetical protein
VEAAEPNYFAYRLSGFTGMLGHLIAQADGEWWFSDANGATRARWQCGFHAKPGRRGLVRVAIVPLWRRYQQRALVR